MNRSDLTDFYNWLEQRTAVTSWQVENVHVWPLIRVNLLMENLKSCEHLNATQDSINQDQHRTLIEKRRLSRYITDSNHDFTADCLFITDTICNKPLKDGTVNIYVDPILEQFKANKKSCLVLEREALQKFRPMPNGRRFYFAQDVQDFIKRCRIGQLTHTFPGSEQVLLILNKRGFPQTAEFINHLCGMPLLLAHREYFRRVLERVKPEIVIFTNYYAAMNMAFIDAARGLGVPTVDLQHGVQSELHAAYGRWMNVPPQGYSLLPNIFAVWTEHDRETIDAWTCNLSPGIHTAVVTGNPWLNIWSQDNQTTRTYDQLFMSEFPAKPNRKRLLFTHQDLELIPTWFPEALRRASVHSDIFFRVHPRSKWGIPYWRQYFVERGIEGVVIARATEWPLLALMRHMDLHATCHSTCVSEAYALGVPSLVITDDGEAIHRDLIDKGYCARVNSAEEFITKLTHLDWVTPKYEPPQAKDVASLLIGQSSSRA